MTVKAIPDVSLASVPVRRRRLSWLISATASMRLGIAIVVLLVLVAIVTRFWTPYNPTATGTGQVYQAPSPAHLFGTDSVGTDIFSQTIAATWTDMSLTVAAVVIAFAVGTVIGALAGFYGGWLDLVTMRLMEILQAFPALLLAMLMVAAIGSGLVNVLFVVAVLGVPHYVRLVRAEIMSKKNWQFAEAARMVGNRPARVLFRHLLPNALTPPIAFSSVNASWVAVIIASLGFIGLGIEPGSAEWGSMISRGQDAIITGQWWIAVFPGLGILLLSGAFYLIGDGLNDATGTRRN